MPTGAGDEMNLLLHIRIPFPLSCNWERQQFADNIVYGIVFRGDKSPNYDSGMEFVIEWICRKFTQTYCSISAYANGDDTVGFNLAGSAVQKYKILCLFIIYWAATHRAEFENVLSDEDIWNSVSDVLSDRVDEFTIYTKLDARIAWANELAGRTLFSC